MFSQQISFEKNSFSFLFLSKTFNLQLCAGQQCERSITEDIGQQRNQSTKCVRLRFVWVRDVTHYRV